MARLVRLPTLRAAAAAVAMQRNRRANSLPRGRVALEVNTKTQRHLNIPDTNQSDQSCFLFTLLIIFSIAGCAFSHDIPAGGPLDQDFGGPLPGGPPPPGGYYGGGPPMPAGAYPGGPVPPPFGAFPGGFPPPPQFGRPGFGFMPPQGPPMHGYGGGPQPGMDEYDSDEDVPPTPAYEIRPGMTFEEIMALKKSAPHEFSDRAGVFDPNLALDALDEHVAALRDYLAQITRRAPAAGASDPLVLPRSYPKPSGSFAAVRRIFDRLRQTKALEAVNGGKVDDAGFMVIVGMGEMDEQLRSLGISYGSSLFPVRESGWIALMEYAEASKLTKYWLKSLQSISNHQFP